jgi:hypothetical protein
MDSPELDLRGVESFGGIDADTDQLLDECFEDHEAFRSVRRHEKYLILGRKGSGKTAIFRKLIRLHHYSVFSFGHTFSDYPWHYHSKQKNTGVPVEQCFLHSWEYLIYLTIAKILLNMDHSQPYSDTAAEETATLETFILDTYGSRDPDISQIFSPQRTLKLKPTLGLNWHFAKGEIRPESVPMDYLPVVIQDVNKRLLTAITCSANPEMEYFICFDELDLGFSVIDPDYASKLVGLLLAARRVNNAAKEAGKRLSVIIFLRDDIYQRLQFEDKNKITDNAVARIEWDMGRTTDDTLKHLMEKRFAKVFRTEEAGCWNRVFNESRQMSGHQTKYQHIIDRTFLRPRDIIKFCNEALNIYKSQAQASVVPQFDNDVVNWARLKYSEYFLNELDDEIHKHIPAYKEYLEVIKTINSAVFKREDIVAACESRKDVLPENVTWRDILTQLFEFSVIGYYRPGGVTGGAEYVWHHKDRRALFNENAATYRVHSGLIEVLGLRRYTWG